MGIKEEVQPDGSIEKFKPNLVAKGFKQKEGLDYFDICSPVVGVTTIMTFIAFASIFSVEIH